MAIATMHGSIRDLDAWLAPFLTSRVARRGAPGGRSTYVGYLGLVSARACNRWRHAWGYRVMISCSTSSPARRGMVDGAGTGANRLISGPNVRLVIDDTALPKYGELSMGVTYQYCGQLGKRASCQSLVSLTLARDGVPMPAGLRLFLPDEWTGDVEHFARAGIPEAEVMAQSKGEIALAELDRAQASGTRSDTVLADAGHGTTPAFRHGLDA